MSYGMAASLLVGRGVRLLWAGLVMGLAAFALVDEGTSISTFSDYPMESHMRGVVGHSTYGLAAGLLLSLVERSLGGRGEGFRRPAPNPAAKPRFRRRACRNDNDTVVGHNVEMRRPGATQLVWAVPVVSTLGATVVAAYLLGLGPQPVAGIGGDALFIVVTGLAFGWVGALVAARQPGNIIGWLFCGAGLANVVSGASFVYGELVVPGRVWGTWLSNLTGTVFFLTVPLVLLLFPDGKPLSPRWRVAVWLSGLAMGFLFHDAFAPGRLEDSPVINPAGVESLRIVLRNPWLGWGAWILLGMTVVAGAVSLVLRYRRSRGVQRQQLKGWHWPHRWWA